MFSRKILVLVLCFLFAVITADSQVFSWGFKGGINTGTPYGEAPKGATGSLGLGPNLGVFVRYNLNEKWSLQIEMAYSYKGAKFLTPISGDTIWERVIETPFDTFTILIPVDYKGWVDGEFNNIYIDFPLILTRKLNERIRVHLGPQLSYLIRGGNYGTADLEIGDNFDTVEDEPFDESDEIKNWDFGLVAGINYETKRGWQCGLRFSGGLTSIYKETYTLLDQSVNNMYLQCTIGYRFGANGFD